MSAPKREPNDEYVHGYWIVAFIDILGQKDAFLRADFVPEGDDEEGKRALVQEVKRSLGVVSQLRRLLRDFRNQNQAPVNLTPAQVDQLTPEQLAVARKMRLRRVRELRWSDGIVLYAPLIDVHPIEPIGRG